MHHPPFCPNPECCEHWHRATPAYRWWVCDGHYRSACHGRVRRYRCTNCGRHFSDATFSLDYFSKRRVNFYRVRSLFTNGSSLRATARQLHVATGAITRRIMILCRQALAAHAAALEELIVREELVADGFQSFWVSQFHPNNFNLLTAAESQYLVSLTQATLRRSGTMTAAQKERRCLIEAGDRPDPDALVREFSRLMERAELLWARVPEELRALRTDEHSCYPGCLSLCTLPGIRHLRYSSKLPRTRSNPLFAVNYLDREIRKDLAEHHRETVCFARNAALSTARLWIYLMEHNYSKPYRISPQSTITHAEAAGLPGQTVRRIRHGWMTRRAFLSRSRLDHIGRLLWMGAIPTPERENWINRRLTPAYCTA